jgi:hypothetical protein
VQENRAHGTQADHRPQQIGTLEPGVIEGVGKIVEVTSPTVSRIEFSRIQMQGEVRIIGYDGTSLFGDSSSFNYGEDLDVIFSGDTTVAPNSTRSTVWEGAGEVVGAFGFNPRFRNDGDLPIGVNVGAQPSFEY